MRKILDANGSIQKLTEVVSEIKARDVPKKKAEGVAGWVWMTDRSDSDKTVIKEEVESVVLGQEATTRFAFTTISLPQLLPIEV